MADQPRNVCRDCRYEWYPREGSVSLRCPGCRGPNVAPVMSLDEPEPEPAAPPPRGRSSILPKVLILVALGAALHIVAGVLAVHLFRDDPAPQQVEVAAKAAAKESEPEPAPARPTKAAPKNPKSPAPKANPKQPDPPEPNEPDEPTPVPTPPAPAFKQPEPAPTKVPAPDVGATTPTPAVPPTLAPRPMPPAPPPAPAAPPPHPFPAPAGWASEWEKSGDIRVRVCGVAVTTVPVERLQKKFPSADPYLVVWVEIENTSAAPRTYHRWQPGTTRDSNCILRYASGTALPYANFPPETGRQWFSPFIQPVPPGGPPVLESIVFSPPDLDAPGPLTLSLDATRVGATGRFSFTIPNNVWAKR